MQDSMDSSMEQPLMRSDVRPATAWRRPTPIVLVSSLLLIGTVSLAGLPYYLQSAAGRVWHPMHDWLRPSGYLGQSAGILALAMFLFLWIYPLRKWLGPRFGFLGALGRWLDVHIVVGLLVPVLAAFHASWRFQGLIGLGFAAMLLVSLSGIVGRYLYQRIPRSRGGLELSRDQAEARRRELAIRVAADTGEDLEAVHALLESAVPSPQSSGFRAAVATLISADFRRRRVIRELKRRWRAVGDGCVVRDVVELARREIALTQQLRVLDATHRLFRLWHVAHRPIAITALVAVLIHVGVTVYLGVTWIW